MNRIRRICCWLARLAGPAGIVGLRARRLTGPLAPGPAGPAAMALPDGSSRMSRPPRTWQSAISSAGQLTGAGPPSAGGRPLPPPWRSGAR
jgi:hypothetical protein